MVATCDSSASGSSDFCSHCNSISPPCGDFGFCMCGHLFDNVCMGAEVIQQSSQFTIIHGQVLPINCAVGAERLSLKPLMSSFIGVGPVPSICMCVALTASLKAVELYLCSTEFKFISPISVSQLLRSFCSAGSEAAQVCANHHVLVRGFICLGSCGCSCKVIVGTLSIISTGSQSSWFWLCGLCCISSPGSAVLLHQFALENS